MKKGVVSCFSNKKKYGFIKKNGGRDSPEVKNLDGNKWTLPK
ncbi:MAG: cold shock domain-containing protein [Desulfobacterales bacterium]|nr:MAG: cold shock domain-containing protein [Desulfobacterales bacterium]